MANLKLRLTLCDNDNRKSWLMAANLIEGRMVCCNLVNGRGRKGAGLWVGLGNPRENGAGSLWGVGEKGAGKRFQR